MPLQQAFLKELSNLETALKKFKYWGADKPEFDPNDVVTPFGVGTITLYQWLQYIYLPKMRELVEANHPLPKAEISPYAEEVLEKQGATDLLSIIRRLEANPID